MSLLVRLTLLIYLCLGIGRRPDETICIMTRDNICLSTDLYYPTNNESKPWSSVYTSTPYGKSSLGSEAGHYNQLGFVFIGQDFRGKYASNGSYSFFRTGGNDTLDTIAWMINQEWSNKYACIVGVSAGSLNQYSDIIGATQSGGTEQDFNHWNGVLNHIRSGYLELGDGLGKNTVYQNGAFRECLIDGWLSLIFEPGYIETVRDNEVFSPWWYPLVGNWTQWDPVYHPNEAQWSIANLSLINFGGWYDIFGNNQIETVLGVNNTGDVAARGQQILVIEPGGHCEGGEILWPNHGYASTVMKEYAPTVFKASIDAALKNEFFDIHMIIPYNILWYMLGTDRDNSLFWIASQSFPNYVSRNYYLSDSMKLVTTQPTKNGNNWFMFDPSHPLLTHGGNNLVCQPCGPWNQNLVEKNRTDLLRYVSDSIENNITLVGKIIVNLYVGSDQVDTDFTAKILDIYDGKLMLVQDGILRMRWRDGNYKTSKSANMVKGEVYNIEIDIGYMSYVFTQGHQIGITISSSNSPRFSTNYNNGKLLKDNPKIGANIANNTIYYGGDYPSSIIFPVVIDAEWIKSRRVPLIS